MGSDVLQFEAIDRTQVALVGGKAAHLGELSRLDGVHVPPGVCVTTEPFRRVLATEPAMPGLLDELSRLTITDHGQIRVISAEIRRTIEGVALPDGLRTAIVHAVTGLGTDVGVAVRSSATTEDLPAASSAGQHDSLLNVVGATDVLHAVRRCWASLFTERAVVYRLRHDVDHHRVAMGVVIQRMIAPDAAGTLFTVDPVTSDRRIVCVEAGIGLGEALVSGGVDPDVFRVRGGTIVARTVATKTVAVRAAATGGTEVVPIEPGRRQAPALDDRDVLRLAEVGRTIEARFGRPQDIEWCLIDDAIYVVQTRPVTTLFPIPPTTDPDVHVYISVGHQQMMTEAMKPLGLSFWQRTTPRPMAEAGGRLFVDVAPLLASPSGRATFLSALERSDPLIGDALRSLLERGGVIAEQADADPSASAPPASTAPEPIPVDPTVVTDLIDRTQVSLATLRQEIGAYTGPALLDFIETDMAELKRLLFDPRGHQVFMSAMEATWWLNDRLRDWLGETNAADTLAQSVPHNVTAEMGLALLDVADSIRPHPQVVAFLESVEDDDFLDRMSDLDGGPAARDALQAYLDTYGMRCVGEIDITRPRWSEHPATLVPLLVGNIRNAAPGDGARRFAQGRDHALAKARDILERVRRLPDGAAKAEDVARSIDRIRTFMGFREYPKFGMVSRYAIYKNALLEEADRLVRAGVLEAREDIFFLRFEELREVTRTAHVDAHLVAARRDEFASFVPLMPPRVFTSDGEVVTGAYGRDAVPEGALVGLAVSAGCVEGRARVVHDVAGADLEPGDILVTTFTDPSWTPAFLAVAGLVTEVGGQMTHGAVIAREYGLPAVVGVEGASRLIPDGRRIRVDGTRGFVEILP